MQASERARELERVYQSRRGHAPQLSISDDSHHVTEAIGDMYGDDHYTSKRSSRPLSFISNPLGDTLNIHTPFDPFPSAPPKSPLRTQMSNEQPSSPPNANGQSTVPSRRTSSGYGSSNGPLSPPSLSRANSSDTATQSFPLNDNSYEENAASLAKELSDLRAIRRMSMDVNTADPDLPSFANFNLPTVAPQHFSEDEDPSKLFWVPARLHPELAPKEFKTFIEEKVEKIRRRSGDADSLSPDSAVGRQGSNGGLRRKKSMLSRQIDNANGYRDGAERLERKRSAAEQPPRIGGLEKLQELAEDPTGLMRRLSIDSARRTSGSDAGEVPMNEDMPILPVRPAGPGTLKRSTRTNYRRGSLRKGERVPFSKRVASRQVENDNDNEESPSTSPTQATYPREPEISTLGINRVNSEPVHGRSDMENFSRPTRKRSPPLQQRPGSADDVSRAEPGGSAGMDRRPSHPVKPFHSRIASNGRTTAPLPGYVPPQVPQIIETPPPQETPQKSHMQLPERNSSRVPPQAGGYPPTDRGQSKPYHPQPVQPPSQRQPPSRSPVHRLDRHASPIKPAQSFDDLISHPSPLPGNSTRTDALSIIPNLTEERKTDKKSKDKKDEKEGSRKTSWGWLLGSDDGSKKEKEEREKELARKVKNKLSKQDKSPDKAHDDTRLDVLNASIQSGRGRESLVFDRENIKLEEERKKESTRKASGDSKKEKESGLFSSIFGGSKKKGEKESSHKKGSSMRGLSPDPPPRIMKPDIDYNWTRFSILEERAIYRMAHIKLANPRRELYSQVLLSNFMYSYLAKVQQMHPQIQIGNSKQAQHQRQAQQAAQQKREQQQQQQQPPQQPPQQPEEYVQYQRYQQEQSQHDLSPTSDRQAENHGYEQHDDGSQYRPDSRTSQHDQQRDSHHSQYGKTNGSYSVSYNLGQPGGNQKQQQSYYGYDDSDQSSRDEEMW